MRIFPLATLSVLAIAAAVSVLPVAADEASPAAAVLDRHLQAFSEHDVDAIMADYHPDAVFITSQGVLEGKAAIRDMFEALIEEFSSPDAAITLHQRHESGPVAYITWSGETPSNRYEFATDTLYVEDDLIRYQTLATQITPK